MPKLKKKRQDVRLSSPDADAEMWYDYAKAGGEERIVTDFTTYQETFCAAIEFVSALAFLSIPPTARADGLRLVGYFRLMPVYVREAS